MSTGCLNRGGADINIVMNLSDHFFFKGYGPLSLKESLAKIKLLNSIKCIINGEWLNPFIGSGFNDQEITIATLLNDSRDFLLHKKRLFYTAKRATVDLLILNEKKRQS